MHATIHNPPSSYVAKLLEAFDTPDKVRSFVERHSDTGGYYAPSVVQTDTWQHKGGELVRRRTLTIAFPSSFINVAHDVIEIHGRRGSIEDCVAPLFLECGIDLDSPLWRVRTTRPDVPWHRRAPKPITFAEAKKIIRDCGAVLTDDDDCYRATAPVKQCWYTDLHELVSAYSDNEGRQSALQDIVERAKQYGRVQPCEIYDCEWCTSAE